MTTHVELYEALKPSVGADAARMIADVVPPAGDLATKADIAEVRLEIAGVRVEVAGLRADMAAQWERAHRWLLGLFVPLWAGTFATLVALVLKR